MITCECIDRVKDSSGNIIEYMLRDSKGNITRLGATPLKSSIRAKAIEVINLKLTADNRLVESKIEQDKHNKEQSELEIMHDMLNSYGIKAWYLRVNDNQLAVTIQLINGKIVTNCEKTSHFKIVSGLNEYVINIYMINKKMNIKVYTNKESDTKDLEKTLKIFLKIRDMSNKEIEGKRAERFANIVKDIAIIY